MGVPHKIHERIRFKAHLSSGQRKMEAGEAHLGSAEPGLNLVQVHLEEESWPRHLITLHICVGGKPTSK